MVQTWCRSLTGIVHESPPTRIRRSGKLWLDRVLFQECPSLAISDHIRPYRSHGRGHARLARGRWEGHFATDLPSPHWGCGSDAHPIDLLEVRVPPCTRSARACTTQRAAITDVVSAKLCAILRLPIDSDDADGSVLAAVRVEHRQVSAGPSTVASTGCQRGSLRAISCSSRWSAPARAVRF